MCKVIAILVLAAAVSSAAASPQTVLQLESSPYGGPAGRGPTGPPRGGFLLSLTALNGSTRTGSPIWVTVEVRNISGVEQDISYGARYYYEFTIVNTKTGIKMPHNPNGSFGLDPFLGFRPLPPNTSMYGGFRLDILYQVTDPGTYSVQVAKGPISVSGRSLILQSNTITITVLPSL
jgi:hypothetical protein